MMIEMLIRIKTFIVGLIETFIIGPICLGGLQNIFVWLGRYHDNHAVLQII